MRVVDFLPPVFLLLAVAHPLAAQSTDDNTPQVEVPDQLSPEAINDLVSKLDAEQTEALSNLVKLLADSVRDGEAVGQTGQGNVLNVLQDWISNFGHAVVGYVTNTPDAILGMGNALASIFENRGTGGSLIFIALLVMVLAVGLGCELLFNRVTAKKRDQIRNTSPDTLLETLKTLSTRALIEIGAVLVFVIVAVVAAKIAFQDPFDYFIASSLIVKGILTYRLVTAILKFVLAPQRTDLRLVYTDDWTAQYTYRNFAILAAVIGIAFFLNALVLSAGDSDTSTTIRFWVSLFLHGTIVLVIWKARKGFTSMILGEDDKNLTPGLERMAAWWPPISMVIIAFNWFLIQFIVSTGYQELTPVRGALAVLLIVTMPFLDTIVRGVGAHLVPAISGEGDVAEKAQKNTRLCYVRVGRVILLTLMVIFISKLWGLNFRDLAENNLGAQFATNSVGFLFIIAVGYMAWEITNLVISRKLSAELEALGVDSDAEAGDPGGAGLTRMATILPILRMTLQVTIVIITVMLALSHLGVNITPLLAGAGVLGLAIGFGAQTLVKDIVSGVFFLLDDAFRVGEFIDIGGTMGTVEKISVRSIQLRGATGPVHIIPYGSMSQLTNNSRDWVIMKLMFTIPFDTDQEKVRKLFKKIGEEMMEDPELGPKFLAPFKGQGGVGVSDTGIEVRTKFTTRPGDQWAIRKEVYKRVQKAFEENGIEFARKEVRVKMPESSDKELTSEQKDQIAAAASEAAETPAEKTSPKPGDAL